MKKKVLFFSPYFIPYISGMTTYPYHIFSHLANDYDITILTFHHDRTILHEEKIGELHVVRMPFLFRISKGFISPQSLIFFWRFARKSDVIFLNIPNFEGFPLALYALLLRKRLYAIFHCTVTLSSFFLSRLIQGGLNISIGFQLLCAHKVIAYTEDYARHTWIYPLFKNKILYQLPPIPFIEADKKYLRTLREEKKDEIWVGYAGRISREKGLLLLPQAARDIKQKRVRLVFAGPYGKQVAGEEMYYQELLTTLKKLDVPYTFFGNFTSPRLAAFMETIDVLVLPSINSTEAFGMVQVEAMLHGCPVIASDLPGVRVPIQLTGMGETYPARNVEQLIEKMNKILSNRYSHQLSEEKTNNIKKIFDLKEIISFYKKLLSF